MSTGQDVYLKAMEFSQLSPGYKYGGGHYPTKLSAVRATQLLDCSSSCSRLLYLCDMWDTKNWGIARASGNFNTWGAPGKGRTFTVCYNWHHVWIQFHGLGKYWRFDTSPWGFGRTGAHVRKTARPTLGFNFRHWPGQ